MRKLFWLIIALALLLVWGSCRASDLPLPPVAPPGKLQPLGYFNKGDMEVSISPTVSSLDFFDPKAPKTFGISYETAYWTSDYTGTGIEIGSYDLRQTQYGLVDHIAVIEDLRLVPFKSDPFWGRFAGVLKLGTETFFYDGSKDIEVGVGLDYALNHTFVAEISAMQHWRTKTSLDNSTATVCVKWRF